VPADFDAIAIGAGHNALVAANLLGGGVNQGTAQVHQQLLFRPTPGLGRAETPIGNLFLAGASVHPGGGVHGAAGTNTARAAMRPTRLAVRAVAAARSAGGDAGQRRGLTGR
jgi:phytoene dehydrogenase-like protein